MCPWKRQDSISGKRVRIRGNGRELGMAIETNGLQASFQAIVKQIVIPVSILVVVDPNYQVYQGLVCVASRIWRAMYDLRVSCGQEWGSIRCMEIKFARRSFCCERTSKGGTVSHAGRES